MPDSSTQIGRRDNCSELLNVKGTITNRQSSFGPIFGFSVAEVLVHTFSRHDKQRTSVATITSPRVRQGPVAIFGKVSYFKQERELAVRVIGGF